MSLMNFLMIWPDSPFLSILVLLIVVDVLMYMARAHVHQAVKAFGRVINNAMRFAARSTSLAEKNLQRRNREVLLAVGREAVERTIEREFHRVEATVARDLSGYPALNRRLSDLATNIDEDYRKSGETPLPPPEWVSAIESVAKISTTSHAMVANILKDIHKTLEKQHAETLDNYRKKTAKRHLLLNKMVPYWRQMTKTLGTVEKTIEGLHERSRVIDGRMEDFEKIRAKTDKAERELSSSSMTQFFISGFVLLIAIGGAVINFNLIALPMSEMVGGGSYIGPFKTSNIAAAVIILVETAMGLYLMESLRITRLFPVIGALDDKLRVRMIIVTFSILFILASVEAALAYMRDLIAADMQLLRQTLAETEIAAPVNRWIPTVGQMVMGFILPFALTFVAIPLESFVHSSRTVMGKIFAALLRLLAFSLRLTGNIVRSAGALVIGIYDLLIFPPLWLETVVSKRGKQVKLTPSEETKI